MKTLPSLKAACYLALGIVAARWNFIPPLILLVTILTLTIVSFTIISRRTADLFIIPALILSGILVYQSTSHSYDYSAARVEIYGTVIEAPIYREDIISFPLLTHEITSGGESYPVKRKVWVRMPEGSFRLESGQQLLIDGILKPCRERRNPGDFNLKAWRERNGYIGELISIGQERQTYTKSFSPLIRLRNLIGNSIEKANTTNEALYKALLIGIRRDLNTGFREDLRHTGLSHLIALSGLHVGFLAGIVFGITSLLRLSLKRRFLTAAAVIIIFAFMVPTRGSTLRAAIMLTVLLLGPVLRRWNPPLNSLGFAALLILLYRPGDLFDAGFQLSFAAVGGIILFHPIARNITATFRTNSSQTVRLFNRWIIYPFLISLSASLMILPITSFHFGTMAVGAPIFNLFAIPLTGLIYAGSWLIVLSAFISNGLAVFVGGGIDLMVGLWKQVIHFFALISPVLHHRFIPVTILLLLSITVWLTTSQRRFRIRATLALALSVAILIVISLIPQRSQFQIWFLDVGHGDAAIWIFPDDRIAIIDGGPRRSDVQFNVVYNTLNYLNCNNVNLLIASHPEADHIGGLIRIVENFPVEHALTGTIQSESQTYADLISALRRNGIGLREVSVGASFAGLPDGYDLEVMGPPVDSRHWSANNASLILMLTVPVDDGLSLKLLTAGDAEYRAETALLESFVPDADLLKVSHHGSPTSTTDEFVAAVTPDVAVISRGSWTEHSRFLSTETTVRRLEAAGAVVYHTDKEGAIIFEPDCKDGRPFWKLVDWRNPGFIRWLMGWT